MSRPWMPLWTGDYLRKTSGLNAQQHGAYLLLIIHYWNQGHLPNDDIQLANIARLTKKQWFQNRDLLASFFDVEWKHYRVEQEIYESEQRSEKYKERAYKGSNSRWNKNSKSNASSNQKASPKDCQSPSQSFNNTSIKEGVLNGGYILRDGTDQMHAYRKAGYRVFDGKLVATEWPPEENASAPS